VESDKHKLRRLSKDVTAISSIYGELVGITAVSYKLFQKMCEIAAVHFKKNLYMDYESALTKATNEIAVPCLKIEDLIWAEIDTEDHLRRVREWVYPRILR
jgi:2-aminoethylphosphonate-pyruvate transaminase